MPQEVMAYTNPTHDGRYKLPKELHPLVRQTYNELHSYQKTAAHFHVSRWTIAFICNPERYQKHLQQSRQTKHSTRFYNKEQHTIAVRTYRAKKRRLGFMKTQPRNPPTKKSQG